MKKGDELCSQWGNITSGIFDIYIYGIMSEPRKCCFYWESDDSTHVFWHWVQECLIRRQSLPMNHENIPSGQQKSFRKSSFLIDKINKRTAILPFRELVANCEIFPESIEYSVVSSHEFAPSINVYPAWEDINLDPWPCDLRLRKW